MIQTFKDKGTEDILNEIINGRRGITPSTALRLAEVFKVSPDFWLNLQLRFDLFYAQQREAEALKTIRPLASA